jgi:hypothetical protein
MQLPEPHQSVAPQGQAEVGTGETPWLGRRLKELPNDSVTSRMGKAWPQCWRCEEPD